MLMFSKTLTETITIQNLEITLKHGMSIKNFCNSGVLYIIKNILKRVVHLFEAIEMIQIG